MFIVYCSEIYNIIAMKKFVIPLLLVSLLIFACDENDVSQSLYTYEEKAGDTIYLANQIKLIIHNKNGIIEITGTDTTNNMYIDMTKKVRSHISQSDASDHMSDIAILTEEKTNEIEITVGHPDDNQLDYFVNFNIILPMIFDFDIENGNGSVSLFSTSRSVIIGLGNGNADVDANLKHPCFMNINIGNGNAAIFIPDTTNADVYASVGNGTASQTGLPFSNFQSSAKQFSGILGNGVGFIGISIGNGNIMLAGK